MSHVGGVVGRDATDIEARRARGTRWGEGAGGGVEDRDLRPRDGKERHLRCGPRLHGAQPSQRDRTSVDRPQKPDLTRLLSERWPRDGRPVPGRRRHHAFVRSEEHTSELQSLMRNSYAVFCLKKKNKN